jgi:amidophosphoribosyltransferase
LKKYRRFVIIDDSIVRSTTMRILVAKIRERADSIGVDSNELEIHIRVASPPIIDACYMGIDMKTRDELVAAFSDEEEIARQLNVTSVRYLSMDGLRKVASRFDDPDNFCYGCLTGNYAIPIQHRV